MTPAWVHEEANELIRDITARGGKVVYGRTGRKLTVPEMLAAGAAVWGVVAVLKGGGDDGD